MAGTIGAGLMLASPVSSFAQAAELTRPIETRSGKVTGRRAEGVSTFLGIPYGDEAAKHRFQPAHAPQPWTGVRDCAAFGERAIQGSIGAAPRPGAAANTDFLKFLGSLFSSTGKPESGESENCLFLNVWTPDASHQRKRPVMVWLHGGGFAQGSGGSEMNDGRALCRRGDVVVVSLNHRLNALGYLYLGAMHPDFADSGNVGQLDIVLALQWVRDNITAFGGDPGNVTIFGESGGGAKVGTLLAMPPAKGLFHKAIQQSGAAVTMVEKADAAEIGERTSAALGVAKQDVHKLQTMDAKTVVAAALRSQLSGGGMGSRSLGPVVDGRALPAHPFDPVATEVSRDIPLIIGTNKDESALFLAGDPAFGKMTAADARTRFSAAGGKADAAFELYSKLRPNDPPTYWVTALMTDQSFRTGSIREAERKAAQNAAPVYMYRLDWETPIMGGALRAPHGLDTPLVFDNSSLAPNLVGPGPEPARLGAEMSQAWINFAQTGDPSQRGLAWPRYEGGQRETMIFNVTSKAVSDPDPERRKFWQA